MPQFIALRMQEFGFGDGYRLELKTLAVNPGENRKLRFWNRWMFIPYDSFRQGQGLVIESDAAITDLATYAYPENSHEHTGWINIQNTFANSVSITFYEAQPF